MKVIPLDTALFDTLFESASGVVKYRMGAKPGLNATAGEDFYESDCSGFVRWILYRATHGAIKLPAGSVQQREWFAAQGYKVTDHADTFRLHDHRLRIGFIAPKGNKAGHVYLVYDSGTREAYGGHGVGSRLVDAKIEGGKTTLLKATKIGFVLT